MGNSGKQNTLECEVVDDSAVAGAQPKYPAVEACQVYNVGGPEWFDDSGEAIELDVSLAFRSKVITERSYGSGQSEFKGWFMVDLLNIHDAENIGNAPSGLVAVPMTVTDGQPTEEAAVVAGMVGYNYIETPIYPTLEPVHGWSMLLEEDSFFRDELVDWDEGLNEIE